MSSKTSNIGHCHDPKHHTGPCEWILFHWSFAFLLQRKFQLKPKSKWAKSVIKFRTWIPLRKNKKALTHTHNFLINSTLNFPDIASILQFWTKEKMDILNLQRSQSRIKETCAFSCAIYPLKRNSECKLVSSISYFKRICTLLLLQYPRGLL